MKGNIKILIVEDDTPVAMMIAYLLTRAKCEVAVAKTAQEGMQLAEEEIFDLITLDVDLPDANGYEICRELKQRHISRHTPIVFVSGRTCEVDRQRGLEAGAVDYIAKPFDAFEFAPRLISHTKHTQEADSVGGNAESLAPITKNAESDRVKVLHGIADKVL